MSALAALAGAQSSPSEMQKAIDEFKTITRELGLRPDSPKKAGRRNGSAKAAWHGRLFENFRNDFLDAVPHEVRQVGETKSTLRRNQFGFNIGGPVLLPHLYDGRRATFFSLSYEGVRENISRSSLETVPTLAEREGDWSKTVDAAGNLLPIYDPKTTRLNPGYDPSQPVSRDNLQYLRDPFPGNRIPANDIDPVARRAVELYPAPNADVGPFFRNNYFIHTPEGNVANGMIGKLDHTLRERHRLSLGLSFSNGLLSAAKWFPTAANPGPADRHFHNRRGSLDYVFTLSARTVNTLSFEASTDGSRTGLDDTSNYPAQLGLSGSPGQAFPFFYVPSYLSMGRSSPVANNVRNGFTWTDSFSARHGKHGFRAVAQLSRIQVNTFWPRSPSGTFYFSSGLTSLPGIIDTGHDFASFLLGLSSGADLSLVSGPSYFRRGESTLNLRHSWEMARGLTLSWGFNLHTFFPRTEKYDRQSTADLQTMNPANHQPGAMIFAAQGGIGRAFQPVSTRIEPVASLAWNPRGDTKTVVRASFWRSYSALPIYFGQFGTQGFNGVATYISANTQLEPAVTLAAGLPAPAHSFPDLRPDVMNDGPADLVDRGGALPLYQSASLSVEREVRGATVITVGLSYVGARDQLVSENVANLNPLPIAALQYRDALNDYDFNRALRPYPQYTGFELFGSYPWGKYQRDAAYVRVEKRASQGLTLSASYEFSKSLDDYSGPWGAQDFFNRQNEWSLTAWDRPQRLSLGYNYELPLGANKAWLAYDDWRRFLVDGWSVSGMTTFGSGYPIALHPMFNNTGGVFTTLYVNVVPGVDPHVDHPSPDLWFNPAAFEQPEDFTMGNAARTHPSLRNPRTQNHDLSLTKRFALAPDRSLEFSAVGLNFLNHANWNEPDTMIGPASAPNVNAGKIIGSHGGRVIQLGLRLSF